MMADNQLNNDNGGDDATFVYTGGRAPSDVRRAKICESIDTIPANAFTDCYQLIEVEGHSRLKKIEKWAFMRCRRLRRVVKMNGVVEIEMRAFFGCKLSEVEFDKLKIIGAGSFDQCKSLSSINLPSVRRVGASAFQGCTALTDAVFSEDLGRIEGSAFNNCPSLRRIAIPLKDDLIISYNTFTGCENLSRVDIVGRIYKTISSLHMKSWRDEMQEEIGSINQTLADTQYAEKATAIYRWIESVLRGMEHYKFEHKVLVKEAMALLELALWKAKLLNGAGKFDLEEEGKKSKKAKIDVDSARKEHRVTCGANIVIKNVLPFLALK